MLSYRSKTLKNSWTLIGNWHNDFNTEHKLLTIFFNLKLGNLEDNASYKYQHILYYKNKIQYIEEVIAFLIILYNLIYI